MIFVCAINSTVPQNDSDRNLRSPLYYIAKNERELHNLYTTKVFKEML